jgi:hypothetical protein
VTARKSALSLPTRTPAFVSREIGAAELCVSPTTWDNWVADGVLPPPAPGFPDSLPRWHWSAVEAQLCGRAESLATIASAGGQDNVPNATQAAEFFRNASKKGRKRDFSA